jgi:hypothetical protein
MGEGFSIQLSWGWPPASSSMQVYIYMYVHGVVLLLKSSELRKHAALSTTQDVTMKCTTQLGKLPKGPLETYL